MSRSPFLQKILTCGVNIVRVFVAATFIFSGVVKLIDPHGTEYKISDYASVFHMKAFLPGILPLTLAVLLAAFEFVLGVRLLVGIKRRQTLAFILLMMAVLTPLTGYLYATDVLVDCGCFGDALSLSNGQTFAKNLMLVVCALFLLCFFRRMTKLVTFHTQWLVGLYSWVFAFCFAAYNLYALPIIDFRPFHLGVDLLKELQQNEEAEYETVFILEKDGRQETFTLDDYPDSTWTFVDSRTRILHGDEPTNGVQDFCMVDVESGEDISLPFLSEPGYKFLLIMPYVETADDGVMDQLMMLSDYCRNRDYPLYALTSSSDEAINHWCDLTGAEYTFCRSDALMLKTMARSNPALMLLRDGMIIGKWSSSRLPSEEQLRQGLDDATWAHQEPLEGMWRFVRIALWYLLPMIVLIVVSAFVAQRSKVPREEV